MGGIMGEGNKKKINEKGKEMKTVKMNKRKL